MNEHEVAEVARDVLRHHQLPDCPIEVLEEGVHMDGDWWFVPVRTAANLPRRYRYYEALNAAETELEERLGVSVLLVPAA